MRVRMVEIGSLVIGPQGIRIVDVSKFEISCMQPQTWSQSKQRRAGDSGYSHPSSCANRAFHVRSPDTPVASGAHALSSGQRSSITCFSHRSPTFLTYWNQALGMIENTFKRNLEGGYTRLRV